MKRINAFIIEKLKVSSKRNIPTTEQFITAYDKYVGVCETFTFWLSELDSIGKIKPTEPNSIRKLPEYKIIGTENFLDLKDNKFFKYPKDTIYLYYFELSYLDNYKYVFNIHYIPKEGLNNDNLRTRRYFSIYLEDLIDIIGEDIYIEIYDYMQNYK